MIIKMAKKCCVDEKIIQELSETVLQPSL